LGYLYNLGRPRPGTTAPPWGGAARTKAKEEQVINRKETKESELFTKNTGQCQKEYAVYCL